MIERKVTVTNETGLHARPAALFVQTAQRFKSKIIVKSGKKTTDAKSILGVMSLGVTRGTTITILAEGEDAREAIEALVYLVEKDLGECQE